MLTTSDRHNLYQMSELDKRVGGWLVQYNKYAFDGRPDCLEFFCMVKPIVGPTIPL